MAMLKEIERNEQERRQLIACHGGTNTEKVEYDALVFCRFALSEAKKKEKKLWQGWRSAEARLANKGKANGNRREHSIKSGNDFFIFFSKTSQSSYFLKCHARLSFPCPWVFGWILAAAKRQTCAKKKELSRSS